MPMFQIPDDWLPVPFDSDDKTYRRRCGRYQPGMEKPHGGGDVGLQAIGCTRATGHPGVCIGARGTGDERSWWMWW